MTETVLAAVRTAPATTELRQFVMPQLDADSALLKVEVAGICGTDVKLYKNPPTTRATQGPVIMGHENVGVIAEAGKRFKARHGLQEGDRVFVEHYVACFTCEWCRIGEYRHCEATDWRTNDDARRFGYTSADNPGTLWGGFSEYMFLPWNAVLHKIPDTLTAEEAGLVMPLSNGIEWALLTAGVGYNDTVLIQGPGQQGLAQLVAAKQAGASQIIVSGTTRDRARFELARELGADDVVDVLTENPREKIMDLTGGRGVDHVLDCTSRAGTAPVLLGVDVLKRREGSLLIQGELAAFPDFPVKLITEKAITIRSARGHSFNACELAVAQLASHRYPLEKLATHRYGIDQVDHALRVLAGETDEDAIHVSMMPELVGRPGGRVR
ncbi:alcohol dehydrogenase catalytic domain-containing protein [Streptomyces cellulosae]|uniref:alcohol dehydrogenase catalytic domain-containing protein n=1 Tax=unclassified Streptomyces TaxID=2593676 RepID=UPI000491CE40|nr:alcohol dehydrogenase catalytic domain-containing protein [Streptomyces sp. McG8]WSB51449.1 alcohol dehydrogenase catalytic domain-containing protein [Streptomyces cellulosae]WSB52760.1 alcohol dehydrogenase catalytic domain-containing protein [Streptomyces cellulosae]WTB67785.1 alcohol dehydrogenase catalytic domain-containing protein [Streptomyces cellulosae]